jgi:hypothetical protein
MAATALSMASVLAGESGDPVFPPFQTNDVVAFIGAANVVAEQEYGFLESLITLAMPSLDLRFRSLAREGDTAFAQPRDVGFPSLTQQLDQAAATVLFVQFGQAEVLGGSHSLPALMRGYRDLIAKVRRPGRRIILVSPTPFESLEPPLPDLSQRNEELKQLAGGMRKLATDLGLGFVDLSEPGLSFPEPRVRLTSNGIHLTPAGHWYYDRLTAVRLGLRLNLKGIDINRASGALSDPDWEKLRQAIVSKNRLWFGYSRPMNWAFLGGDRVEQPSSRDHRDLKVRWFPAEMEQFIPLLHEAEFKIHRLARETQER